VWDRDLDRVAGREEGVMIRSGSRREGIWIASIGQRSAWRSDVDRVMTECGSCGDAMVRRSKIDRIA
jgi:hypothetical protein